jgi:hypothetical protein
MPSLPSAAASGLDFGDVNLAHFHHRDKMPQRDIGLQLEVGAPAPA